ncbi:hypothetical protein DXC89_07555 [Prevotella disiens]|uniref:Uncharacterized protein n=1 Tax=Prevotella disiens TaxID=28130 RepID=A0A3E4QK78_9BACT|nr:hypothetical protein DXC89_07555 [Prevotella disiens]
MKRKLQNFSLHQVYILGNFILMAHETILMALSRRVDGAIKHRIKYTIVFITIEQPKLIRNIRV